MEGIIYKVQPYQEHARLLFVYTPNGKKTLLAQGSQKVNHQYRILAQYLTLIEFKDKDKSFIPLQEAKILNDYANIKTEYQVLKQASLMIEIINLLIVDNLDHQLIFNELIAALGAPHLQSASLSFALKLLRVLGYGLQLTGNGKPIKGIHIDSGGIIYQGSTEIADLDIKQATQLVKLLYMPYDQLEPVEDVQAIQRFIFKYYQYHLQTTLKTLND